jgi:hypothetical protein
VITYFVIYRVTKYHWRVFQATGFSAPTRGHAAVPAINFPDAMYANLYAPRSWRYHLALDNLRRLA